MSRILEKDEEGKVTHLSYVLYLNHFNKYMVGVIQKYPQYNFEQIWHS